MNDILAVKQNLVDSLRQATAEAQQQGKLPEFVIPEIALERPQNSEFGDYASSLPLKLAKVARMKPMDIAAELVAILKEKLDGTGVEVAAPGFINFTLSDTWLTGQIDYIIENEDTYGNSDAGEGTSVQIEFVSANPTGPLHVGHGRGAILGSALADIMNAAGFKVQKEFYINDAGNQVQTFSRSLYVRYQQVLGKETEMPDEGYFGTYMIDLAREIQAEEGDKYAQMPEQQGITEIGKTGVRKMLAVLEKDLADLGVVFDIWFSEQELFSTGQYKDVIGKLEQKGYLVEREDAVWFASTALGEDKDNVIVRSDGTPTYFATDIVYHHNKLVKRNFDRVIDIWGADHQGHIPRMKAVLSALDIDPERLEFIISQMVTLHRGKELVKLSKRSGEIITLREVMEEVGADACRFFFLARSADSQMDFDLELARKQSADNPVYYVQYAHARISSIFRHAQEKGFDASKGDTSMLTEEPELTLIRKMILLPEIVELIAKTRQPHHLTYYSQELATVFHSFYKQCRVVSKNHERSAARLKLVQAARIVLARSLRLMGVSTPDSM